MQIICKKCGKVRTAQPFKSTRVVEVSLCASCKRQYGAPVATVSTHSTLSLLLWKTRSHQQVKAFLNRTPTRNTRSRG